MSFSNPATPPVFNPNDQQRFSSWRESDPVPMAMGCVKTGLKWMTDQFNLQNPAAGEYGSYFVSSIVGCIGLGPIHRLGYVWISGQPTFALNMSFNSNGYADTPVPAWLNGIPGFNSVIRVYQGTETQLPDAELIAQTGQQHPSYKGLAYAILFNANWGVGATGVSNVEIEWISVPGPINGWQTADDNLWGINPIAGLYALLSHRRGGSGMGAFLNAVTWSNQAQALETSGGYALTGTQTHCHLCYTSAKDAQSLLAEAAVYFDGFYPLSGQNLSVNWRPGQSPSATGLTVLSDVNHAEKPDITSVGRDAMPSIVILTYTENGTYATRASIGQVSRNIAAAPGNQTSKKYDFPFLKGPDDGTTTCVPQLIVARFSQDAGVLDASGTSKIFRRDAVWASGTPLNAGDLFVLNYSRYQMNRIVRIKAINDDATQEYVEIEWIRERGAFPTVYTAPVDARVVPFDITPAAIATTDICPFFLPAGFGTTRRVAMLLQRPTFSYASATIWYCSTSGGSYASLGTQSYWAVHAKLTTAALATDASIAVTTTGIDMDAMQSEASLAQSDDTLLAIIPSTGEVLSVGSITTTSTNNYSLAVLRGRRSSVAAAAALNADVWLVYRSQIVGWANAEWQNVNVSGTYNAAQATKYFQVAPSSMTQTGTAAPSGGVALQLPAIGALTVTLSAPTAGTVPPQYTPAGAQMYGGQLSWTPDPSGAAIGYNYGFALTPNTAPTSFTNAGNVLAVPVYSQTLFGQFGAVQPIYQNGSVGQWSYCATNWNSVCSLVAPKVTAQTVTIAPAGATGPTAMNNVFFGKMGYTATGGSSSEAFTINITGAGFSAAPIKGDIQVNTYGGSIGAAAAKYKASYDPFDSAQTATSAKVWLATVDGSTIPASATFSITYEFKA